MKYLIKDATICDKHSSHNGKKTDVLIVDGIIAEIGNGIKAVDATVISFPGLQLSPGWMDLCANFCDPGFEFKESLESGANAAVRGGFTHVVLMPVTQPVVSGKTQVEYIVNRSAALPVTLLPCGSLSSKFDGENLSEMYDMSLAGAVAFSDYKHYVKSGLMSRAQLYAKNFGARIFSFPFDPSLAGGGMMHEGAVGTALGLKGIPELSEEIVVIRDLEIASYNESDLHFMAISSPGSLKRIEVARKNGMKVTTQIAAHQIYFCDEDLREFDTNLKVLPPLRTKKINDELIKGLVSGSIDCIVSDHTPEDPESKKIEFDHAEFGISSIETVFPAINKILNGKMKLEDVIEKISCNPRKILGLADLKIEKGQEASLTLFDSETEWTFDASYMKSKSKNTPYQGKTLKGKVFGTIHKSKWNPA